jgi:hypothetical protein
MRILLLCFRATGHYWQLAVRQLCYPPDAQGESFPYRRTFVSPTVSKNQQYKGLICLKFDASETNDQKATYVPLRFVESCNLEEAQDSELVFFSFQTGSTVHYQTVEKITDQHQASTEAMRYSELLRTAVESAMAGISPTQKDDDHVLCIDVEIPTDSELLSSNLPGKENARWTSLARLLSSHFAPNGARFRDKTDLCFTRLTKIAPHKADVLFTVNADNSFVAHLGTSQEIELLSVFYPSPAAEPGRRILLKLGTNPDEAEIPISASELYVGTSPHRFEIKPTAIADRTPVTFGSEPSLAQLGTTFITEFFVPCAFAPKHLMSVTDQSDPNRVSARLYRTTGSTQREPQKGDYVTAPCPSGVLLLRVEEIQMPERTKTGRDYTLRLIGGTLGGGSHVWNGIRLVNGQGAIDVPLMTEISLAQSANSQLKALLGASPGTVGRCIIDGPVGPNLGFDLKTNGFDSVHSAVIGQTGSGKSYSTGVILEGLLKDNKKVIVLDPNSDFIHMAQRHKDYPGYTKEQQAEVDDWLRAVPADSIVVLTNRAKQGGDKTEAERRWRPCRLSFSSLSLHQRSALIHVTRDDVDLYAEHRAVSEQLAAEPGKAAYSPKEVIDRLFKTAEATAQSSRRMLAERYLNYNLASLDIWENDGKTASAELRDFHSNPGGPRLLVVDLGSIQNPEARLLVAANLLEELWALGRADSQSIFLVLDEAHNFVRPDPALELERATTEALNRIAGEGRKYGLNLILMTQRPSKIHPHCLGMVSNLVGMKVSNQEDLKTIQTLFGNVPPHLLNSLPYLGRGEALIFGKMLAFACLARFGQRFTEEGVKEPKK